jgi:hypothetical protein
VARNCHGKYNKTTIVLSPEIMYTECPISKLTNTYCSEIYLLIKQTLMGEFGAGVPPTALLQEPNVYFIYKDVISKAENDFKKTIKEK